MKYWTESNCELLFNIFSNGSNVIARDRWCVWKLEFPEKSCSSWRSPSRFTYNHCKVLVMNPHVSFWDAREVIDSILWWGFHLVRSRISLTFFSSRINNIYYFSSRGFFFGNMIVWIGGNGNKRVRTLGLQFEKKHLIS